MLTKKINLLIALMLCSAFSLVAENAETLMKLGNYSEAAKLFAKKADASPSDAMANLLAAEAYLWARDNAKADAYAKRAGAHALYLDAVRKMLDYNLDEASELLEKYTSGKNAKTANTAKAEQLENRIEQTRSMLERVEKIVVVDSLQVPRNDFFKAYRLSPYAGSLLSPAQLPDSFEAENGAAVFRTQLGNKMMWGALDDTGRTRIVESGQLADGSWETPHPIDGAVNAPEAQHVNFPYVLSDGVTMYFASDDPESSFGGLDIYISRFDSDKYLEPQNLGMPYNSPYNDYMFVIDETTGAGWWATDRNAKPGMVTIYIFQPSDLRVNYPVDTPALASFARLDNIARTQPDGFDKKAFLNKIDAETASQTSGQNPEFEFALPDGRIITDLTQFQNPKAADALENYLEYKKEYDAARVLLNNLRADYRNGNKSVASHILDLESQCLRMQHELLRLSNLVVSAEK